MAFFSPQFPTRLTSISTLAILGSSLAIGTISYISSKSYALTAQEITPQPSLLQNTIEISFRQPNTRETGAPLDRPRGGGSRCGHDDDKSSCIEEGLTALVPFPKIITLNEQGQEYSIDSAWGQTLEAHPTLWFHLPYGADMIYATEFELWTEEGDRIFHTTDLPLAETPSITGYTLPETVSLDIGETYRWNLLVQSDPLIPSLDEMVSGRIQRVSLPAYQQQPSDTASLSETAQLLAHSGIWYDLLTTMVAAYPQDRVVWQTTWQDVLTDVGLPDIAIISLDDAWAISLEDS